MTTQQDSDKKQEEVKATVAGKGEAGKEAAMELAEAARQQEWEQASFTAELFRGKFRWDLLNPFPMQSEEDRRIGDELIEKVRPVLEQLDPFALDELGNENHPSNPEYAEKSFNNPYPKDILEKMAALGLFGMKIPKEYGGLGLTITNYARVLGFVGSYCSNTVTLISAHQSIGVPEPLKEFGTQAQKEKYYPRLAGGEISAFALTETDAGSDPARVATTATPSEDGSLYTLNGDKLWCTNGLFANLIVVMAKTGEKEIAPGKSVPRISAFIVETDWEGVKMERRCQFMGLRGIMNGVITFTNVKIPAENMIGKPGQGLKIALTTLNTGRLGLPAAAIGGLKHHFTELEQWANDRVQWGCSIGKHQSVAKKIANYASDLYAMQSMVDVACAFADGKQADIRLEAAAAKYFCTETVWRCLDDYVQIRGGRGYETAWSLYGRGEAPSSAEMNMRDMRIGRIFEGSSEIMQLIMAREAMDTHFSLMMPLIKPKKGQKVNKIAVLFKAIKFYLGWYPKQWLPAGGDFKVKHLSDMNQKHLKYAAKTCKRLARRLFHTMGRYQAKLEYEQLILGNYVDIGTDLFVMAAALSKTEALLALNPDDQTPQDLADLFCRNARNRIEANFKAVNKNHNKRYKHVADLTLDGKLRWLSEGGYLDIPPMYRDYEKNDYLRPAKEVQEVQETADTAE